MKKLDPKSEEFRKIVASLTSKKIILPKLGVSSPKLGKLPSPKLGKLPSPKLGKLPSPKLGKLPSPKSPKLGKLPSPKLGKLPSPKSPKLGKLPKIVCENMEMLERFPSEFLVLDNGGNPFKVKIEGENVIVSDNTVNEEYPREDNFLNFSFTVENVDEIWVGCGEYDDYYNPGFFGNTVLLVKGQKCISVASEILEFNLSKDEKVTRYISTVGNSGVPYGWIETNLGYYALHTFNCVEGILFLQNMYEIDYKYMNCWQTTQYPYKNAKSVSYKTLIPRA